MVKKFWKVCYFILSVWLGIGVMPVRAYDNSKPFDGKDVATWTQGAWEECHTYVIGTDGESTIQNSGCGYFAIAYALVKAGIMDTSSGTAPIDFIKKVVEGGDTDLSWGHMKMTAINKYYPQVTCDEYLLPLGNADMSTEQALSVIKDYYNKGKFVIASVSAPGITSGHYVFFDSFKEDGTPVIGDSGKPFTDFKPYLDAGVFIKYCTVFSIEGVNCNELASIYSENVGETTGVTNGEMTEEEKRIFQGVVKEFDLEGMQGYNNIIDAGLQRPIFFGSENDLTIAEQRNVEEMGSGIDSRKLTPARVFHISMSFVGICLVFYGVLMLLAYLTDYNNTFAEVSLLKIISFGKFMVLEQEDIRFGTIEKGYDPNRHITYMSVDMLIKRIVLLFGVGILLLSGIIGDAFVSIIFFFRDNIF